MKFVSDPVDTLSLAVAKNRTALLAGQRDLPAGLGLTSRAAHIERGERECFGAALADIAAILGPAARLIDVGSFAGLAMGQFLSAAERPKAAVVMTPDVDERQFVRLQETASTAEITHVRHDAHEGKWPLETIGAGKTLVILSGGGLGLMAPSQAFSALEQASQALLQNDLIALTLEMHRDGATLDVTYRDFGHHLITQALSNLGRAEGLEAKTFYDASSKRVRFGAVAGEDASLAWNGTRCAFEQGAWLDMGAMQLHTHEALTDLHPDFAVHDQWQSHDRAVTLLLLRKI